MRVKIGVSVLLTAVLLGMVTASGPLQARAAGTCAPGDGRRVTVLARPGIGHAFLKLDWVLQTHPYLDSETSRVIVPVRSLVTAMSTAPNSSSWDEGTRTATFRRADRPQPAPEPAPERPDCSPGPMSLREFLRSPAQTSRQAARATACRWVLG